MENACYAAPQDSPPEYGEVVDIYHISNDAPPNYADVMEMKNQNENGKQMESIKTLTDNLCETDFTIYKDHLIMPHDSTAEKEENVENSKDENDPQPQEWYNTKRARSYVNGFLRDVILISMDRGKKIRNPDTLQEDNREEERTWQTSKQYDMIKRIKQAMAEQGSTQVLRSKLSKIEMVFLLYRVEIELK